MTALADRVAMPVERADFDDLVTLVTPGAALGEGPRRGRPHPAARDRRGEGERARPDPRPLDVAARARRPQGARPQGEPGVPGGEAAARRGRELARPPARGERREARAGSRRRCRSPVGAALLASAEGYTPRANAAARPGARGARPDPGDRERARREPARAEGARAEVAPPPPQEAAVRGTGGPQRMQRRRRGRERRGRRLPSTQHPLPGEPEATPGRAPRSRLGLLGRRVVLPPVVALAQEPRQLGGERVARRQLAALGEGLDRVGALLELLDVGLRLRVGGDGLADLRRVLGPRPRRARSCRSAPRAGRRAGRRAPSPRAGSARARRSAAPPTRGSPTGGPRCGRRRGGRRRSRSAPRSARAAARAPRRARGSVAAPVTGAGRVCGTSASSAPSVTTSSTPRSRARPMTRSVNARQR